MAEYDPDVQHEIVAVTFGTMSAAEIRRLAVCQVTDSSLYEKNSPKDFGMNSLLLGTCNQLYRCKTCKHDVRGCVGHWGYIEMAVAVYNPIFTETVLKILRCVCFFCSRLLAAVPDPTPRMRKKRTALAKLSLTLRGKKCAHCKGPQPDYARVGCVINRKWPRSTEFASADEETMATAPFSAQTARDILELVPDEDVARMYLDPLRSRPENMIFTALPVPPPIVRPSVAVKAWSVSRGQEDLTVKLVDIIKENKAVAEQLAKGKQSPRLGDLLQWHVCLYLDKDTRSKQAVISSKQKGGQRSLKNTRSVGMRLTGKRGRLRGTCNGKRVDFSARSVITPEVSLDVDELGVPRAVAMTQTVPEMVTRFNRHKLLEAVRNGPDRLPGAQAVVQRGVRTNLSMCKNRALVQLEAGDVVHRTLRDGDWVVFNRQPTLHKASMMGHKVRVMDGMSFRLSLPCTIPYNADFDGDEMNMHVPQGVQAAAEVQHIMSVTNQLLSAQKSSPSMGLVQDSLIGGFLLTSRDTFLPRGLFFNCLMQVHYGARTTTPPPPAVFCRDAKTGKVAVRYTGKQLLSAVFPTGLSFARKTRDLAHSDPMDVAERWVEVQAGELLCGQVGKEILGAKAGSAVHIACLDLSRRIATELISDCQRVMCAWLASTGFSVGVGDCLLSAATERRIEGLISDVYAHVAAEQRRGVCTEANEKAMYSQMQKILPEVGRVAVQEMRSRKNNFVVMVESGAKGSNLNIAQIGACIGQTAVNGQRVQPMADERRSLPCFAPGTEDLGAYGFCVGSFSRGLSPAELFMHAMAGREGLVDTAVKTAKTGYFTRKLQKSLEDVHVAYDGTVRTNSSEIVMDVYNGDGFDAAWLERVHLPEILMSDAEVEKKFAEMPADFVDRIKLLRDKVRTNKMFFEAKLNTQVYSPVNVARTAENVYREASARATLGGAPAGPRAAADVCLEAAAQLALTLARNHRAPGPATVVELVVLVGLGACAQEMPFAQLLKTAENVRAKMLRAIVQPGEMVGSTAAASMGEPTPVEATRRNTIFIHCAGTGRHRRRARVLIAAVCRCFLRIA